MRLFVAGLSYKTAPVEVREKLAFIPGRLRCRACRLKLTAGLVEVVILSTCNRVEIYAVSQQSSVNAQNLFAQLSGADFDFSPYLYVREDLQAAHHLFAVAGGLDSMVIGETEITGQVKQAYQTAQGLKLTGPVMNKLFQAALQVAKEIRTQTQVGRGATSVGSVAVELAEKIFDQELCQRAVLIIGAGKMGEACVRHLAKKGARSVLVANRSAERAQELAAEFGGRAMGLDKLSEALTEADIVVSSTGATHTIVHRADLEAVMPRRRNRPLFLIDIAVPRDIEADVENVPGVYLYNVDHLEEIVRENVRLRERELGACREIITRRAKVLMERLVARTRATVPTAGESVGAYAYAGA